jgi:glycosyltransferase involved in cell wall biosynthesis
MPTVSVIIPTYNRAAFLREAIESVRAQTYQDWELIVVDDGSTDDAPAVMERFTGQEPRIRYIRQQNGGATVALNRGLRDARGEYIAILDDDDRWLPEKLSRQVDYLVRHADEAGVFCFAAVVDRQGNRLDTVIPPRDIRPDLEALLSWRTIWTPSLTLVRRSVLQRVQGFDERLKIGYDRDLWIRVLGEGRMGRLDEVLVEYRTHGTNISKNWRQILKDYLIILEKLQARPPAGVSKCWCAGQIAECHYKLAWDCLDLRAYRQAATHLFRAIAACPTVGLHVKRRQLRMAAYRLLSPYGTLGYALIKSIGRPRKPHSAESERQPVRIAHLSPSSGSPSGMFGSNLSLFEVLRSLDRTRIAPHLFTVAAGPMEEEVRQLGIPVVRLEELRWATFKRPLAYLRAIRVLAAKLRVHRIDLVDLNILDRRVDVGVLYLAARLSGAKFCVRNRMVAPRLTVYQHLWIAQADLIISVSSRAVARWFERRSANVVLRVRPERLRVIPDGRPMAELGAVPTDRTLARSLGVPDGGRIVGMVGALHPNKRQDLFLEIARLVHEQEPDVWFLVVGGPYGGSNGRTDAYEQQLRAMASENSFGGRVIFTGYRRDALSLMRQFDILVLTSVREGLPGVLIEALGLGVPAVASNAGGVPEVVEHGVTGTVVGSDAPEAYAQAILDILRDPQRAARMREASLAQSGRFDSARITRLTEQCYEAVVRNGHGRS